MSSEDSLAAVVRTLALPDDDFFAIDGSTTTALQARVAKIVQTPPLATPASRTRAPLPELRAIGAPSQLDWARHASFPLLLAEVRSNQREWEVHSRQNRLLIVSNLDTGAVDVMAPLDKGRRMPVLPPSGSGPPIDEFNAGLSSIGVLRYDLLQWFKPAGLLGRLAVTAVDYDLASNTVPVHAAQPGRVFARGASLSETSRIDVTDVTPFTRAGAGVTLTVPAIVPRESSVRLHASIRLPASGVTVTDAAPELRRPALLAASLLLVRLDSPSPVLVHLAVPASLGAGGDVGVEFDLDLADTLAARATAGNWLLYLIVGNTVTGPRPLQVGTP